MSQTYTENVSALSPQQVQKQRKKQVKRQTKMMLKLEEAKREVQKAEMKIAKARLEHEIATTRLHNYEEELNKMRGENSQ
jgi:outer membrane protein TolC